MVAESGTWPIWAIVAACGVFGQAVKLLLYSVTRRHLALAAMAQGNGLPSLPATLLTCLLTLVIVREGWSSSQAGFALVFAVLVVHDTVKLSGMADRQRAVLAELLERLDDAGRVRRGVAAVLDPRAHHPSHVLAGVVLGALFALAFTTGPR